MRGEGGGQDEVLKKTDPRRQVDSREVPPRTGRGQPGVPGVQTQLRDAQPHQQPDEPDSQPAQEVTAILLVPYTSRVGPEGQHPEEGQGVRGLGWGWQVSEGGGEGRGQADKHPRQE